MPAASKNPTTGPSDATSPCRHLERERVPRRQRLLDCCRHSKSPGRIGYPGERFGVVYCEGTSRMTLPRVLVALMLLPATAAAQQDGAREGLVITPRWFGEEVAESRHTGRLAQAADDAPRTDGPNVSVHVYGGWRQLWGGDVNEAAANTSQATVSRRYEGLVPLQDGDAPAIRRGPEYGADVTVHLTPRFGLVGGVGWIESSSTGRLIETPHSRALSPSRSSADLTMRSVPVRFGAQYTHPIGRRLSLVVDGGAGLYFTNLQWSRRAEIDFIFPKSFIRRIHFGCPWVRHRLPRRRLSRCQRVRSDRARIWRPGRACQHRRPRRASRRDVYRLRRFWKGGKSSKPSSKTARSRYSSSTSTRLLRSSAWSRTGSRSW